MKNKEIVALAKKIAAQEKILQKPDLSSEEKQKAEMEIMKLCSKVKNFEDMLEVDEKVQEFLTK